MFPKRGSSLSKVSFHSDYLAFVTNFGSLLFSLVTQKVMSKRWKELQKRIPKMKKKKRNKHKFASERKPESSINNKNTFFGSLNFCVLFFCCCGCCCCEENVGGLWGEAGQGGNWRLRASILWKAQPINHSNPHTHAHGRHSPTWRE